ncbi:cation-translocating P-type ATPase [Pseudomaricurvus hydrocarbonicus]|nr:HAD-IC family P-type ATPase [Aestuariicella hydrocarbonica]
MDDSNQQLWHHLPLPEVLAQLDTDGNGLSAGEAQERLTRVGSNDLPVPPPPAFWRLMMRQFKSPLIYVLLAAALLSLAVGHLADASFIAAVLLINALIGSIQEFHAHHSAMALRNLMVTRAQVLRNGEFQELDASQLVPGDLIKLTSGDRVPADLRLIDTQGLEIDESFLTGESLPVQKDGQLLLQAEVAVPEMTNLAFAGSLITSGRGQGIVTATGLATEMGRLSLTLESTDTATPPLLQRIERFSKKLTLILLVFMAVLALVEFARHTPPLTVFMTVVALAVSAIPEALPVALTMVLSVSMRRMVKRHVVVRKLVAVESLGSCTVIAADKTGTLTQNRLTASDAVFFDGDSFQVTGNNQPPDGQCQPEHGELTREQAARLRRLARVAALCNEAELRQLADCSWHSSGDMVDQALLAFAHKCGVQRNTLKTKYPLLSQLQYEPARGFAATLHRDDDSALICVKGALEVLLPMCDRMAVGDGEQPLDPDLAQATMQNLAAKGVRVLALAEGARPAAHNAALEELQGLCLLGLIAMMDPLRPEAINAVNTCQEAGIKVCMLTGDHPETALSIARKLHLAGPADVAVTGGDLTRAAASGKAEVDRLTARTRVYARVAPEQKMTIVQSLMRQGEIVAVTGDGINDAPALNAAHVGIAMGKRGTDVAKEAADLILTDDNFASVVDGIEQGRIAYQNIRKVVFFLVSTGVAEIFLFTLTTTFGLPLPLSAVQLLWLNLVTGSIQTVGLALEPGEENAMHTPPRPPRESLFNRLMIQRVITSGVVMGTVGFLAFSWLLAQGWEESDARNSLLLLMVLFENIQVFNSRSENRSVFRQSLLSNPVLLMGTAVALGLHIVAMYLPVMQTTLGVYPVGVHQWTALLPLALSVLVAMEIILPFTRK